MVSPDGPDDVPPALIALNDNDCTSDSGIDESSTGNIAMGVYDYERRDSEKRTFRKRRHSALIVDEGQEKVMKEPPTSPFLVTDAFLMDYNLAGEEYLSGAIEKFLE